MDGDMKVEVKLFARARDLAGAGRVEIELPEAGRVADLRTALADRYPELSPLVPNLLIAVGSDYADDSLPLAQHSDVACFPPVSGG
jgi:molybdopterin converting factor small subunit